MIINSTNLDAFFIGMKTVFNTGFDGVTSHYRDIAMVVPSSTREEHYGWLGQFPGIREWIGPRHVKNLTAHGFAIKNRKFENTVSIDRESMEDDRIGVFAPLFTEMGKATAEHPDELSFGLLKDGFTAVGYDGQPFFDTDHPVGDPAGAGVTSVSNMQAGDGPPWFLLDTSRSLKPLIYQQRMAFDFTALTKDNDENVFLHDEYVYGVRGRSNVGFGLWQLAFASKDQLNAENYEAARAAMMVLKGDEGRLLGIKPTTLVVPPSLEGAAMRLLNNGTRVVVVDDAPVAVQNEWAGTAKPIVTPWLA